MAGLWVKIFLEIFKKCYYHGIRRMVEARSDFAKKVSLRENKTLPNWKIIFSIK